jgi:NAD(P)-dependent dehydrogenase (short-subunit alcohol dehydrogenase family)
VLIERANVTAGCLDGEVAVVTGAGRGIGRETARALAFLGASVAIAEISESGLSTQSEIRARGGKALWVKTDVSDPASYANFRDCVQAEFGRVDILVNNAEAVVVKAVVEHSLEEWESVFAVNCRGVFLGIQLFMPAMLERHHGTIIFMPSAQGMPYVGAYSASKAAQESLSSSLAQEVKSGSGVSVITFGVGMVKTPATEQYVPKLATRFGMTDAEFVAMAAPGGSMISADLCATGLVGVILHAAELHGEQVDWPAGLAKIGLSATGVAEERTPQPIQPSAVPKPSGPSTKPDDVLAMAVAVENVVKAVRAEFDGLGTFQKQWYKRTLRHRTGMDVEGWERAAHNAVEMLRKDGGAAGLAPDYVRELRGLTEHFVKSEADWRGYVKDPAQLDGGIAVLEERRSAVQSLIDSLNGYESPHR